MIVRGENWSNGGLILTGENWNNGALILTGETGTMVD
jgi:hypothetical protein